MRPMEASDDEIRAVLLALAQERGPEKSFCPSEAARRLAEEWRPLMPRIRTIAGAVGLRATQKGRPVDPETAAGPIRLSQPRRGSRG